MVRGSNPGGGEIFRICPDRHWGPPSLLYIGYRVFPGGQERPGPDAGPSPLLVPLSRKSRAIPLLPLWAVRPVQSLSACTRVHFTYCFTNLLIKMGGYGDGKFISFSHKAYDRILYVVYDSGQTTLKTAQCWWLFVTHDYERFVTSFLFWLLSTVWGRSILDINTRWRFGSR